MTPAPEAKARLIIDKLLAAAGWHVCDTRKVNIHAACGVAIREFPLALGHGFADYLLYVDGQAAGVIEAAVEGKLTEEWRQQHPDVEPADKLLERILAERREKWQGRGKYKEPIALKTTNLPELPEGWV